MTGDTTNNTKNIKDIIPQLLAVAFILLIIFYPAPKKQVDLSKVAQQGDPLKVANCEQEATPKYHDFAVSDVFTEEPVKVNLASNAHLKDYDQAWLDVLVEESAERPNFAGHYRIVELGCGTECQSIAAVDAYNGNVIFAPFAAELGVRTYPNSSLMVVNPPDAIDDINEEGLHVTEYYKFENEEFIRIE